MVMARRMIELISTARTLTNQVQSPRNRETFLNNQYSKGKQCQYALKKLIKHSIFHKCRKTVEYNNTYYLDIEGLIV